MVARLNSLEDEGYEFNTYDPYFSNKIIKGSQMTVCFYVEYLKVKPQELQVSGQENHMSQA